jgi:hypothetical protein
MHWLLLDLDIEAQLLNGTNSDSSNINELAAIPEMNFCLLGSE